MSVNNAEYLFSYNILKQLWGFSQFHWFRAFTLTFIINKYYCLLTIVNIISWVKDCAVITSDVSFSNLKFQHFCNEKSRKIIFPTLLGFCGSRSHLNLRILSVLKCKASPYCHNMIAKVQVNRQSNVSGLLYSLLTYFLWYILYSVIRRNPRVHYEDCLFLVDEPWIEMEYM